MPTTKSISNEDILELLQESMQIASENFVKIEARFDQQDERMHTMQTEISETKQDVTELRQDVTELRLATGKLQEQTASTANEIKAIHSDINEILHRLDALEAELRLVNVNPRNLQTTLQDMLDKIKLIADKQGIKKLEF